MIGHSDKRDFEAFVEHSSDKLLRTAYLLCGDRGHAEDLVQTALLRTARHWPTARRNPGSYTRRVLVNLATDRWRSRARQPSELPLESLPGARIARIDADVWLDRDALLRATRALPARQRAVLVLRFFDDLSVEETAAALGISTGTVKSQTFRALNALRSALTDHDSITHPSQKEIPC
jgi:RNA polymerase sigma-70 factor (sigma-E family)